MPKGEHFRKYPSKEKLDEVMCIRINSIQLFQLRQLIESPQEWIRANIRNFIFKSKSKQKQESERKDGFINERC